jgi:hypothetical protein
MRPLVVNAALGIMAQTPSGRRGRLAGFSMGSGARGEGSGGAGAAEGPGGGAGAAEGPGGGGGGGGGAGAAEALPRGVPIGLPRQRLTLEVPIETREFQGVVQTLVRQYFYPILANLPKEITAGSLNELFQKLDNLIGNKLQSYILQLSSRAMPQEVVFDVTEFEALTGRRPATYQYLKFKRSYWLANADDNTNPCAIWGY